MYSSDFEAMYPSLEVDTVAKIAAEEFLNNKVDVDVDTEELSLYLSVVFSKQELVDMGLKDVTYTRVSARGQRPGITTEEILERSDKTISKFNKPARVPINVEEKKMFSIALESLIKASMKNHIFSFNGDLR